MARRSRPEAWVDFSECDDAISRAVVFFGVLAYPESGAGDDGPGAKFADALQAYGRWAAWRQYGRGALRERGIEIQPREQWEGTLRRGSRRIQRRLAAYRFWCSRGAWIEGDWASLTPEQCRAHVAAVQQRSIRSTLLADPERWRRSFSLKKTSAAEPDQVDLLHRLASAIKESRPVLHMAWQLDRACWECAKVDQRPIRAAEKLSWRSAWFRSEAWIDAAICAAETWRREQEPFRQNGLAGDELIELGDRKSGEIHPISAAR